MPEIIDQYHGDPTLTRLFAVLEDRPRAFEAVKTASFNAAAPPPRAAYAWRDEERFPVHTREDTIASLAYRAKYAGAVPAHVDAILADAAEVFGIPADLFEVAAEKDASAASAAAPTYAVPEQRRLPLGSAEQVKVAEEVLLRDGLRVLGLEASVQGMQKVAQAAETFGVPLQNESTSYAALSGCNTHLLRDRIGMRAVHTKVASVRAAFDELDAALSVQPTVLRDRAQLVKLAARIHELDELGGLTPSYGRKIFDPMLTVFNEPSVKIGGAMVDVAGKAVDLGTLMQLPASVWEDLDVPEMAELAASGDATHFQTVFDTLPRDIKVVLAGQLP